MPELPEVETIVNQLHDKIVEKRVVKVEIFDKIADPRLKNLSNFKFKHIFRRAKNILMALDDGQYLLTHLGMTGQFFFIPKSGVESNKNIYVPYRIALFHFEDGSLLSHNNIRKFGGMKLLNETELQAIFSKLGPEPLSAEFSVTKLKESLLKKPKANLKTTLMDQSFISGIGNIYAQEALYHAGISPLRKCGELSEKEIKLLHEKIRYVLQEGIKHKGTSVDNYIHLEGEGDNQKYLAVYGKESCPKKHKLQKIAQGGRGTSYCPVCQK